MRDYYARFWCAVWNDLKIVAGKESLLSIIAGLLAVPIGAKWGYVSSVQIHPALMTALSVLGVIFIARVLIALAVAPVRLDQERQANLTNLTLEKNREIVHLNRSIAEERGTWAKGAADADAALAACREDVARKHPSDQVKERHVRDCLAKFDPDGIDAALKWLLHAGEAHQLDIPAGFQHAIDKACVQTSPRLVLHGPALGIHNRRPGTNDIVYYVNPEYKQSLANVLFPTD